MNTNSECGYVLFETAPINFDRFGRATRDELATAMSAISNALKHPGIDVRINENPGEYEAIKRLMMYLNIHGLQFDGSSVVYRHPGDH